MALSMRKIVPEIDAASVRSQVKLFCIGVSSGITSEVSLIVVFLNLNIQY